MGEWGVMDIQAAEGRPLEGVSKKEFNVPRGWILTIFEVNPWPWRRW